MSASNNIMQEGMMPSLTTSAKETAKVWLEYVTSYVEVDGRLSQKTSRISEILLEAN